MQPTDAHGGWPRAALVAVAPPLALLATALLGADGPRGLFQADLAALVAAAAVGAFAVRLWRLPLVAVPAAALLGLPAHLVAGGTPRGGLALALLLLAVGAAAAGLAAVGRGVRAPWPGAGLAAAGVLYVAMTGLVWADDVGDRLPAPRRFAFKQAVLHLDAATACAYDAADFDRFHDPSIYDHVKLASSAVRVPAALGTGLCWLAVGALGLGLGFVLGTDREGAVS